MTAAPGIYLLARLGDPRPQQRPAVRPVRARPADRLPHHRTHPDVGHRSALASGTAARTTCSRWAFWPAATSSATTRTRRSCRIAAVETVSTAFMGLTVGCAKCHDHMYDPIKQSDFYSMKALFDPLVVQEGDAGDARARSSPAARRSTKLEGSAPPSKTRSNAADRALTRRSSTTSAWPCCPADVRAIIRKPEKDRTVAEQKIADDYFPVLRIDPDKIQAIMPADDPEEIPGTAAAAQPAGGGGGRRGGGGCRPSGPWKSIREGAGEELHPDQRRPRAAREGQARASPAGRSHPRRSTSATAGSKRSPTG